MLKSYDDLLAMTGGGEFAGHLTQNRCEKGINGVLNFVSANAERRQEGGVNGGGGDASGCVENIYQQTLDTLRRTKNDRLWFKTNLKLGHLLLANWESEGGEIHLGKLAKVVKELVRCCEVSRAEDERAAGGEEGLTRNDHTKLGTQLLETFALAIRLHSARKDHLKLAEVYQKALEVRHAIPHPRTTAVINECGGKMHMQARQWEAASTAFFEAFKAYDEAGDPLRLQCLKYLVLANMLGESNVDPFDAQEAKPYRQDEQIVAMNDLINAFHGDRIRDFERILAKNHDAIMTDRFVARHIDDLLRTIRSKVLLAVIRPYTKISLAFLAHELNGIPVADVEILLVGLILDRRIAGSICQVGAVFMQDPPGQSAGRRGGVEGNRKLHQSVEKWAGSLSQVTQALAAQVC